MIFIVLAGNGSYSTGTEHEKASWAPMNEMVKDIPVFIPERKGGFISYRIHPSLDRRSAGLTKSDLITSDGISEVNDLSRFLLSQNPDIPDQLADEIAIYYFEEAKTEGINHDIAFSQMCLETGFLAFGGVVNARQNNFCGLGATGENQRGESFAHARLGVRAHIQHLKAYACESGLAGKLADKRFKYVRRGSAPRIDDLTGRWATDPGYGAKIHSILSRLHQEILESNVPYYPV